MVSFATTAGSGIRSDLKSSSGGGSWLRGFKEGKDCRVRFLQDPEEWLKYKEHYSQATKFFPCTQDQHCPGCNSDDERMKKASRRYIAQALIVQEADAQDVGKVAALKLAVGLANRLVNKADRNGGTLLDRDYTIIRTGNGLDTDYDVEVEDKRQVDISRYELVDPHEILNDMYESAWGKHEEPKPAAKAPGIRELIKAAPAPTPEEDTPPFDPAPAGAVVESGPVTAEPVAEVEITEEHLRSLDKQGLLTLLSTNQVKVPGQVALLSAKDIVDWVIQNLAE